MTKLGLGKKFRILVLCGAAFWALAACSNIGDVPEEKAPQEQATVKTPKAKPSTGSVKVLLDLPFAARNNIARSAVPSNFIDSNNSGNLVFAGSITQDATPQNSDLSAATYSAADNSISIPFTTSASARNNYYLNIYAFPSNNGTTSFAAANALLRGTVKISIEANANSVTVGQAVKMLPNASSTVKGAVSLAIKIPAEYYLICDDTANFKCTGSAGAYQLSKSDALTDGIAPGTYTINFYLQKKSGTAPSETYTTIYTFTEEINIFPGMTTDKWNSGIVDASGAREVSVAQIYSTFFVRGENGAWFDAFDSAPGNNLTGDGSIAAPYNNVQYVIDKIAKINDGTTQFTIYVDGRMLDTSTKKIVDFSEIGSAALKIAIVGLRQADKATIRGNSALANDSLKDSVIKIPDNATMELTLKNLVITEGQAVNGGGIYVGGGTVSIEDCEINANGASGNGGGIYIAASSTVEFTNCVIGNKNASSVPTTNTDYKSGNGNYAANSGGGIYALGSGTNVTIKNCSIKANYTGASGGGICAGATGSNQQILGISNSEIKYNYAQTNGGGMNVYGQAGSANDELYTNVYIKNTKVIENKAAGNGGGINLTSGQYFSVVDCSEFSGNTADSNNSGSGKGNGIYHAGSGLRFYGKIKISDDVFLNSTTIALTSNVEPYSASDNIATITPASYPSGSEEVTVLSGNATAISSNYAKFAVTDQDVGGTAKEWEIDNTGKLAASTSAKLETVYLNSSVATSGDGTESSPVKTLTEAFAKLDTDATNPTIVIMAMYEIPSGETGLLNRASASGNKVTLQRYYKDSSTYYSGNLIYVGSGKSVTVTNITIDGNFNVSSSGSIMKVAGTSGVETVLTLGNGAVLKNNSVSSNISNAGCVVTVGSDTKFYMEDGSQITGNSAYYMSCLYIASGATAVINGGSISDNDGAKYAIENRNGTLTINGGTISNNKIGVYQDYNNGSSSKTTIAGGSITGGTTGVYVGSAYLTITGGSITGNATGVESNQGSITMTGGTIKDNTSYGISSSGSIKMSGGAKIDANNVVYLYNTSGNRPITVGTLSGSGTVAKIKMYNYNSSYNQILQADGTNVTEITPAICDRFVLDNSEYIIKPDPSDSTKAIFAKPSGGGGIILGDNYTFTLKKNGTALAAGQTVAAGDILSFTVSNSSGEVTDAASYKIMVKQNNTELPALTKTSTGANTVTTTIPQALADQNELIDVYMFVTVGTEVFEDYVTVQTSEYSTVALDDLATYLKDPSLAGTNIKITVPVTANTDIPTIGSAVKDTTAASIELEITGSVTQIGGAFRNCTKLTSVKIPNGVTTIGNYAFQNCNLLAKVEIPNSVTTIGGNAFYGCASLASVDIPSNVTSIDIGAFQNCTSLASVDIPANVTTIGKDAFAGCTSLESVTVRAETPPALGSSVFSNNKAGRKIYVPNTPATVVSAYQGASGWSDYASDILAMP